MNENIGGKNNRINCFKCVHFKITWEKKHPYSCLSMGFKSAILPSMEVFKVSGSICANFKKKT